MRRRLRVAIFSTGDEIVEPGSRARRGRDLRRQPLSAARPAGAARRRGHRSRHPADDPDAACARALREAAAGHDLVLTSGGVSTGEADHVRGAVERDRQRWCSGASRIKPGRPVAMGVIRGAAAQRGIRRLAGQSGRGVRHLRAGGAAAAAAARGRRAASR